MEPGEPQHREGWFSWLRPSTWAPCQPEPADTRDKTAAQRGQFFPFLGSNAAASARRGCSPPASNSSWNISSVHGSAGGSSGDETRGSPTQRRVDEKQLRRELPSIWRYLQEHEGWSFANTRNWDVRGPAPSTAAAEAAAAAGGGGRGSGDGGAVKKQAGSIPQGEVRDEWHVSTMYCITVGENTADSRTA